ncbi:XRE family transcriptional regulator [Aquabacterium sp. NJ1]|uniref:response regulator n=1 Tax=Aquabacterium sp. NJ1 TaxID=1538295 RepID=UPI00052C4E81|nr:response regulator [Aquabacterium sp. NJ1]KGM41499.1 XRE family transcriptional regulator [Aquabacterium sp. NJ1]
MTDNVTVRLLVVDDHNLFRRGLIALLSRDSRVSVVAEARDAGEALKMAQLHKPDVILLDNHLPGVHGVDALPQLYAAVPQVRIVMLTVSEDADDLAQALSRGAAGYLLKTIEGEALVDAILRVRAGESVVSPEMTTKLIAAYRQALSSPAEAGGASGAPLAPLGNEAAEAEHLGTRVDARGEELAAGMSRLSPRERDILREIARGASNKEIARTLDIAETTVKIHVQHILRKLNLTSRVQAAVFATSQSRD